jgi:hypothetical protein
LYSLAYLGLFCESLKTLHPNVTKPLASRMTKKLHVYLTDAEVISGIRTDGGPENKAIEAIYEQNRVTILGFLTQRTNATYAKDSE